MYTVAPIPQINRIPNNKSSLHIHFLYLVQHPVFSIIVKVGIKGVVSVQTLPSSSTSLVSGIILDYEVLPVNYYLSRSL